MRSESLFTRQQSGGRAGSHPLTERGEALISTSTPAAPPPRHRRMVRGLDAQPLRAPGPRPTLRKGFAAFLPEIGVWSKRQGQMHVVRCRCSPAISSCAHKMDKHAYIEMLKVRGLVRILEDGWNRLTPVPDHEVAAIERVHAVRTCRCSGTALARRRSRPRHRGTAHGRSKASSSRTSRARAAWSSRSGFSAAASRSKSTAPASRRAQGELIHSLVLPSLRSRAFAVLVLAGRRSAAPRAESRHVVIPSVLVGGVYDDNVSATRARRRRPDAAGAAQPRGRLRVAEA